MKNYKLFQICYTINFFGCVFMVIADVRALIANWNSKDRGITFFIIIFILAALFGLFDWCCHQLMQSIKSNTLLSKKITSVGENLKNACLVANILFLIGLTGFIINTALDAPFRYINIKKYYVEYSFIAFMFISFYLCLAYWLLQRQHNLNFTDSIENIGTGNSIDLG